MTFDELRPASASSQQSQYTNCYELLSVAVVAFDQLAIRLMS